jgi:AraC family ethanolamine operon transcriptional activator
MRRGTDSSSVSRIQIVHAAMNSVDQHDCEYLSVVDLATAAGVSERTLRSAFQEYFGVGPVRYLKLRILNQARKALQNADSSLTTVTQIAIPWGIWELGRFAQDYRLLFDELPSKTLRRN